MRFLAIITASLLLTAPLLADGPADNVPDKVRPIPPAGIEVPAEKKQSLLDEAVALDKKLAATTQTNAGDRAQVSVFTRAIRMTVEDGMFYTDKEVEQAAKLLKTAEDRLVLLAAGKTGAELIGTPATPTDKPQLVVGGFTSKIDGSVQPFGLVLPAKTEFSTSRPLRLDVWLHGRGEKVSEIAFLHQRLNNVGEIAPENTIVLHPYGRYCNAFKFAGEVDVLEAIDHVKRTYSIDEDRIVIRGFSMGGAGCWQMAVHYPGKWMAATPGAGFSETRQFLKIFQKEEFVPTAFQESLLHWYDCPDWSNNLRLLPTIAYSGEIDNQKQAADVMEAAMKDRGLQLKHIIGPQTAHKLHPDSKIEIEKLLAEASRQGRPSTPKEIDFTTYSLRYATNTWLTIEGMEKHWQEARVHASITSERSLELKTKNVTRLTLEFPLDQQVLSRSANIQATIDGHKLTIEPPTSGQPLLVNLEKANGAWRTIAEFDRSQLRKRPGLQGPIDDAFMDGFVFVSPDSKSTDNPVDQWINEEFAHAQREWRKHYRGDVNVRSASQVSEADIADKNLVLFGTPTSNPLIARVMAKLPPTIAWKDTVAIGSVTASADKHVPVLIYPNPLNPGRYVVINSGFTFREFAYLNNARQIAMLPDWAIIDVTTGRNYQMPGKVTAAGFFGEDWQVK